MRVVYMGTPDFAVGALQSIIDAGHDVVLAVTQPDKERGRGKAVSFSPVKECALANGIEVFQPERIREADAIGHMRQYEADVFVVAAFGQILPGEILEMPKFGCINIHASLLPKYRGAAPIQWCVINGEEKTGVTIMQMDEGLDTGDILMQEELTIAQDETGGSLFDKLADLGAKTIVQALDALEKGTLTPVKQDNENSTYAGMLRKEMGRVNFSLSACEIERLIRGLNPWPSAYTSFHGKKIKLFAAEVIDEKEYDRSVIKRKNGEVVAVGKDRILIKCGKGILAVTELQLEGKKRMSTAAYLLGYKVEEGEIFGVD